MDFDDSTTLKNNKKNSYNLITPSLDILVELKVKGAFKMIKRDLVGLVLHIEALNAGLGNPPVVLSHGLSIQSHRGFSPRTMHEDEASDVVVAYLDSLKGSLEVTRGVRKVLKSGVGRLELALGPPCQLQAVF
ncbi:hypothetical protein Scep_028708 [Stephania cephalantha]|uniref:Uncharacterized protein n=1 Tax=Stephania cephalantha TaxID=152367 RepID=A0AAP0HMC5_9MAGN